MVRKLLLGCFFVFGVIPLLIGFALQVQKQAPSTPAEVKSEPVKGASVPPLPMAPAKDEATLAKERAAAAKHLADDAPGRKAVARTIEENFLRKGVDLSVTTEGAKATTMKMKYVLFSRPFIFQLQEDQTFLRNIKATGFQRLIVTDGYDKTWTWDLTKTN